MKRVLSLLAGFFMVLAIYSGGVFSVSAQSNLFAGGSGDGLSPETAFLIATAAHLDNVRSYLGDEHADKYFKLIEDIDLNAAPYNQGKGGFLFFLCVYISARRLYNIERADKRCDHCRCRTVQHPPLQTKQTSPGLGAGGKYENAF